MPTVLRDGRYRFFFWSNEYFGTGLLEPPHIHVKAESGSKYAKFWLDPVSLAKSHRFARHELTDIESRVQQHRIELLRAWDDHFRRQ
jgi:Domain of unknown function (DUF4160)